MELRYVANDKILSSFNALFLWLPDSSDPFIFQLTNSMTIKPLTVPQLRSVQTTRGLKQIAQTNWKIVYQTTTVLLPLCLSERSYEQTKKGQM